MDTERNSASADKGTNFSQNRSIRCGRFVLDLKRSVVMGILNVTGDSFYDGGRYLSHQQIIDRVGEMMAAGAGIIDIGALSTRPGTSGGSAAEEEAGLLPALEAVVTEFPEALISADTYRASVAKAAVSIGACMINDISGGTMDADMLNYISTTDAAYVLMHIQGTPLNMQQNPFYHDVVGEVKAFFEKQLCLLTAKGKENIILDPGFGFGKDVNHNYQLLEKLVVFKNLGFPLLAGLSRKSMINKVLNVGPEEALNGTTVLNTIALMHGADILRVHDVKEAVEAVKLVNALNEVRG